MSAGNIKVVVRCRPLNSRESGRGAKGSIRMEGNQTILDPPESNGQVSTRATEKKPMTFSFDKSYWSAGPRDDPKYASQQTSYNDLGVELLDHSFEGFNTCIFAYGQTGSGKSYSMMGYGADKGIIPSTTSELFRRVEERSAQDPKLSYIVEVSYIEIYNEKVRDLLNPKNKGNLRVREHPSLGPYVEDLSRLVVENDRQMMTLMDEGNKARTVASTNMNETSSRSHAVFTVILTQKRHDAETNMTGEKVSKISLVDSAGSERQASTGATGTRSKEGANINKSSTTLGKVIAALAQASDSVKGRKKKDDFVPYRDSVSTWSSKESLGGNSKTAMIAAISPADYEETLSTSRYADAAKRIKTHAVVNEDPNAKSIRELKEELEMLRSRVSSGGGIDESSYDPSVPSEKQIVTYKTKDGEIRKVSKLESQDQLQASEKLMESLNLTWEQKMAKTQAIHVEREKASEESGILVDKHMVGVHAPQKHPSSVNSNEDPLMSECLVYQSKPGSTTAGGVDDSKAHIKLSGENILPEHCVFTNEDGIVTVEAMPDARTFVNGKRVPPKTPIKSLNGFRVILGDFHVFRFNDPAAVRAHREKLRGSASMSEVPSHEGSPGFRPDSPGKVDEMMDWSAARREVADIAKLGDQDLDKLFDDIIKVRTQRKRPESRMDSAAEIESRSISTTQTEESAENPWAGQIGTTMTSNSFGTPAVSEIDKDQATPAGSDEHSEGDTALPLAQMFDQRAADAALEQQHLTKQSRTLAQELKKTRSQAAAARASETSAVEPANWSAKQMRLVQKGVSRWKLLRTYKMAEQISSRAVDLREANVIAKTMKRQVEYNFSVVDGQTANPASSLDDSTGVVEFEDVSSGPTITAGPVVVVKVVDREAQAVYTWDLDRFSTQLNKMRHVLASQERPNYSLHFRAEGTFTDSPAPSWSFIGAARVPLRLMNYHSSHTVTIPIQCQHTMEAIGSCRVTSNPLHAPASGATTPGTVSLPMTNQSVPGTKSSFSIVIDTVKGLSAGDFASVHAQTRLSSSVGSDIAADDIFASLPVDLDKSSVAHSSLRRNVSVIVTPDLISHLETGHGTIEFFAKVRPEYLDRLERFDRNREVSAAGSGSSTPSRADKGDSRPMMRRCETDFIASEHHDISASVCIKELASDGAYEPAEVFDSIVHSHQGVQRQIHLTLSHSSGKASPWVKVTHFSSGDIRVKTNTGIIGASRPDVELRGVQQEVTFDTDGTSRLDIYGVWDTASHHCIHLDRKTASESKVSVKLTWSVEVSSLDEPAVFHLDLPIRISNRDTRRSSSMALFTAPKIFKAYTAVFSVDSGPPLASTAGDLWRLDTGKKHVIGEEILGDWKPRSISLLEDWERSRRTDRTLAEVQSTKVVLNLIGDGSEEVMSEERRAEVIKSCVALWMKAMEHRVKVDLGKRSEEEESLLKKSRTVVPDLEPKLVPTVRLVNRVDKVIKQGPMMFSRDPQANEWEKRYFVSRRPFLHVHPTASEREVQVINSTKATVVPSPDVELLSGKRFAFTVFTSTNSYVFQAGSAKEMSEWIGVMATTSEG